MFSDRSLAVVGRKLNCLHSSAGRHSPQGLGLRPVLGSGPGLVGPGAPREGPVGGVVPGHVSRPVTARSGTLELLGPAWVGPATPGEGNGM